jgi:hypothetical protein
MTTGRAIESVCKAAAAGLLMLLAACATHGPARQDEAVVKAFAAKGYAAAEHDATSTATQHWRLSGQDVSVVVAQPARPGVVPVVIYVPGLGESSAAGDRWRAAWSAAGYAVMSVQPLDEDAAAWRSELARTGEFKALGHQRYSAAAMNQRVQMLADVVDEAKRRANAGDATWKRMDWGRTALAGFDLGAYTTMAVAGEHVRDVDAAAGRLKLRAAMALSPYATTAAGSLDTRYRDVQGPVLSVTSDADADPLGLVEGTLLRRAPFDHMTGADKFLLSLDGLPHAGLSGTASGARQASDDGAATPAAGAAAKPDSGQRRRSGKHQASGDTDSNSRGRAGPADGMARSGLSATALQMRLLATQDVTTAFLDAYVKDDPQAREWLAADASRWLGAAGTLRHK